MLDCLSMGNYWVAGEQLLKLADIAVTAAIVNAPQTAGSGMKDNPFVMTGDPKAWLALAVNKVEGTKEQYFNICGRRVKKIKDSFYMVDAGSFAGAGPTWNKKSGGEPFDDGGPSYRNISAKVMELKPGTTDISNWTKDITKKLLLVLQKDSTALAVCSPASPNQLGAVLPTIAATLFIAEPARNKLAFLVNKLLIDMMATGVTYGGRKPGSAPNEYRIDAALHREEAQGGGKIPAAMATSAGASGEKMGYRPKLNVQPGQKTGPAYTQSKELTIICHALTTGMIVGTNQNLLPNGSVKINITDFGTMYTSMFVDGPSWNIDPVKVPGYLKYLLGQAMVTFKP